MNSGIRASRHTLASSASARWWPAVGLLSVAVILGGSLLTATVYTGHEGEAYSPLNHFISELGQLSQSRLAPVFNAGLILGAMGLTLFNLALARSMPPRYGRAYALVALISGIGGGLVGVFPMDYLAIHAGVAFTFFLTGWILVVIFSLWQLRGPDCPFPRWLVAEAAVVVVSFLAFLAAAATATPTSSGSSLEVIANRPSPLWTEPALEWLALLSLLAWFGLVALVILTRPSAR